MFALSHCPRRTALASLVAARRHRRASRPWRRAAPTSTTACPPSPSTPPAPTSPRRTSRRLGRSSTRRDRRRRAGPAGAAAGRQRAGDRRRRRRSAGTDRRQSRPRQPRRQPGRLVADAPVARADRPRTHARRPGAGLQARRHAPTHPRGGLNRSCGSTPKRPAPCGPLRRRCPHRRHRPGREIPSGGGGIRTLEGYPVSGFQDERPGGRSWLSVRVCGVSRGAAGQ